MTVTKHPYSDVEDIAHSPHCHVFWKPQRPPGEVGGSLVEVLENISEKLFEDLSFFSY